MDGSTASLIIIPLAVACSLAAWLIAVYHADSHPRWKARQPAPRRHRAGPATLAGFRLPGPPPRGNATRRHGRHPLPRRNGHRPAGAMDRPSQAMTGASR